MHVYTRKFALFLEVRGRKLLACISTKDPDLETIENLLRDGVDFNVTDVSRTGGDTVMKVRALHQLYIYIYPADDQNN